MLAGKGSARKLKELRRLRHQFADSTVTQVGFKIKFHRGDDHIWAEVVGVPGLATQGRNAREIMNNLSDAISLYFDIPLNYPDDAYLEHVKTKIPDVEKRESFFSRLIHSLRPRHIEMKVPHVTT